MSSLGFRPPQFSEDSAYLPSWLQNPQLEASANSILKPQSKFSQVETLSREEGRCNSFKLFLSGDDTTQASLHPSPNVLHLRLRLSSDGESQDSHSKSIDSFKALDCSNEVPVPSMQQLEISADLRERLRQSAAANYHREAVEISTWSSPVAVENVFPQSVAYNDETERRYSNLDGAVTINSSLPSLRCVNFSSPTNCYETKVHGEKFSVRNMKDSDVIEAIELSIAASEALAIHDLMRTELTQILQKEAILEAALQVKQARLEALGDVIGYSPNEIGDMDFLSDLDDLTMENSFKDVGMLFKDIDDQHDCFDVSQVKDTPISENLNVLSDEPEDVQLMAQQDKDSNGSALGLNECELVDLLLDHPTEKNSDVAAAEQPQADASSYPTRLSENTGGENGVSSRDNKFRSRWLGGWTVKGAVVPAKMIQFSARDIPRFFNCETSSLSESGGVAADENSFVHNHITSQSSMPFEGARGTANEGNFISQEVRSSNQSVVDPLCSVVPCSISTENTEFTSVQNQDNREADAENNNFYTKSEFGTQNFLNVVDLNNNYGPTDKVVLPTVNGQSSEATVWRKVASLRTYSTLLPKHDVSINGQQVFKNQGLSPECVELVSSKDDGHSGSGSCKKNSNFTLSGGGVRGKNQVVFANHDEPVKDGAELKVQSPVQRTSPRILNRKGRCRLHPSELLVESLPGKRSPKWCIAQGTQSTALKDNKFSNIKSKLENAHSAPNIARKQVLFAEAETEHHQNKVIQKPPTSERKRSSFRANKKSRYSKLQSGSWSKDLNICFTNQPNEKKMLIFHRQEFLLTGFSSRKEREIVRLINEYGGMVLSNIPSPPSSFRSRRSARSVFSQLPIIISSKKLQTAKFLYGCAVNSLILKVKWLTDSVAAGSSLPPEKYMVLPNQNGPPCTELEKAYTHENSRPIFDRIGIILHGKTSFCTKSAIIIKHGGGLVFKTLQRLFQSLDAEKLSVGAIIAEDESKVPRHLKHCASERNLAIVPASWIAKSLHLGKLLPLNEKVDIPTMTTPHSAISMDWSQEI